MWTLFLMLREKCSANVDLYEDRVSAVIGGSFAGGMETECMAFVCFERGGFTSSLRPAFAVFYPRVKGLCGCPSFGGLRGSISSSGFYTCICTSYH